MPLMRPGAGRWNRRAVVIGAPMLLVCGVALGIGAVLWSGGSATGDTSSAKPGATVSASSGGYASLPADAVTLPAPTATPTSTTTIPASTASTTAGPSVPIAVGSAAARLAVSGQVTCTSGKAVEGIWVAAIDGAGFATWTGVGAGSTASYHYTLPGAEPYSLHVGCGGSTSAWDIADYSPQVTASQNSFACVDVVGAAGFGTCAVQ